VQAAEIQHANAIHEYSNAPQVQCGLRASAIMAHCTHRRQVISGCHIGGGGALTSCSTPELKLYYYTNLINRERNWHLNDNT